MRTTRILLAFVCIAVPSVYAGDDLKIQSHWWTSTDVGSTVTYVKGDLIRVDDCWGEYDSCVQPRDGSLTQCGGWSFIRLKGRYYDPSDGDSDATTSSTSANSQQKPGTTDGLIRVVLESVDTGERKQMFGYTARHIVTTTTLDVGQASCPAHQPSNRSDGWYIDPPYKNKCSDADEREQSSPNFDDISDCGDKVVIERKGPALGFALTEQEEHSIGGFPWRSGYTVTGISHENLDQGLFAKPDARPISELRHPRQHPKLQGEQPPSNPPANQ
jgi:hypothetical protein